MQTNLIYLIASLFVISLIGTFVIRSGLNKKAIKKNIAQLEKTFNQLKSNQIDAKLVKIENVAISNPSYSEFYQGLKERHQTISSVLLAAIEGEIEKTKIFYNDKKYKQVKLMIKETNQSLDNLYKKYQGLEEEINLFNKKEEEIRIMLLPIKERFRLLKVNFHNVEEDLSFCRENFEQSLEKIEKMMLEVDVLLQTAYYNEATYLMEDINKEIDFYSKHIERMPKLVSFSLHVLPKRLNESLELYQHMKDEGYPLYNFKVNSFKKEIESMFDDIRARFDELNYEGIEIDIKEAAIKIEKINEFLQNEMRDKEDYDARIDLVYNKVNSINKKMIKAKRDSQSIEGFYYMDEVRKDEFVLLFNKVQVLDRIKGDLDSFVHSITKQPYSLLKKKMDELENYGKEVEISINQYIQYIQSLRDDSQNAYDNVNKYSIEINQQFNKLRYLNHQAVIEKYQKPVEEVFSSIDEINDQLSKKPLNVATLNLKTNELMINADALVKKMKESESLLTMAQNIIVFTNKYRSSFSDVNEMLDRAQIHFENGEFEFAIDQVSEMLKTVHPKAYEEMMKRRPNKEW